MTFNRGFYVALGLSLNLGAGLIAWQVLTGQSVVNGCYNLPLGFASLFSAYQGGCPFNFLPIYYALDLAFVLLVTGSFTLLIRPKKKGVEVG